MHLSRKPSLIWTISIGALMALALTLSATAEVTEEFHRTVPLSATGRFSLENVNGGVTITGWDRNEVQIDAVKKASDQQKLTEARIEVEATSDSVHVRTKYPEGHTNNNPANVTYEIHVPRTARLDAIDLVNGSLTVHPVFRRSESQPGQWLNEHSRPRGTHRYFFGQWNGERVLPLPRERQRHPAQVRQRIREARASLIA